jgi:hypothetical protein
VANNMKAGYKESKSFLRIVNRLWCNTQTIPHLHCLGRKERPETSYTHWKPSSSLGLILN